ncbi:patched [Paraphysoderma sedebokerense]|nr:patched [Paraphysoderma sedebokerense]
MSPCTGKRYNYSGLSKLAQCRGFLSNFLVRQNVAVATFVARYPYFITFFGILLALIGCIGLKDIYLDTDITQLFSSRSNDIGRNAKLHNEIFGGQRIVTFIYEPSSVAGDMNVLQPKYLNDYWDLENQVMSLKTKVGNQSYELSDLCYKLVAEDKTMKCFYSSITQFWPAKQVMLDDNRRLSTLGTYSKGFCGMVLDATSMIGGMDTVPIGNAGSYTIRGGKSLRFMLLMNAKASSEAVNAWEREFAKLVNEYSSSNKLGRVWWLTQEAPVQSAIETYSTIGLIFGLSFALSFAIVAVVSYSSQRNDSKIAIGIYGLFISILASCCGIGITAWSGITLNPLAIQILPFFVVGIAMDTMFILSASFSQFEGTSEQKLQRTMATSGTNIVISSFIMTIANFLCTIVDINLVRDLSMQLGTILIANCFLQMTVYAAGLVLNDRAVRSVPATETPADENSAKPKDRFSRVKYAWYRYHAWLAQIPSEHRIKRRMMIVFGFIAILPMIGIPFNVFSIDTLDVISPKTNVGQFLSLMSTQYNVSDPFFITLNHTNQDFTVSRQAALTKLYTDLRSSPYLTSQLLSWFENLRLWTAFVSPYASTFLEDKSTFRNETIMLDLARTFLNDTANNGICQKGDVIFDVDGKIKFSRFMGYLKKQKHVSAYWDALTDITRIIESSQVTGTPSSIFDSFFVQFDHLLIKFLLIVGLFLITTAATIYLFLSSMMPLVAVLITIILITTTLFGLFPLFSLQINGVSVMNSVIAIGLAVDYLVNILGCYKPALLKSNSQTRPIRAANAAQTNLRLTMESLTKSTICSLFSLAVLAFAEAPLVKKYFCGMYVLMLVIIYVYSLFIFPTLLGMLSGFSDPKSNDSGPEGDTGYIDQ